MMRVGLALFERPGPLGIVTCVCTRRKDVAYPLNCWVTLIGYDNLDLSVKGFVYSLAV